MQKVEEILRQAWENIRSYKTGSLELNIQHPLEWHVAYETPTTKALIILANYPINDLEPSKSINTFCNQREDGKYYISFQLVEKAQEDVFISMCSNLISFSEDALNEKDALKRVGSRYRQWRRLMEYKNLAILSDEKRKGLIGEVLYLNQVIKSGKAIDEAIAGWVGPDGADQDFVYEGKWFEVKTTGLSSDKIEIHSVEQLGGHDNHGKLIVYRVDSCAPEAEDAFTLRSLIKKTMNLFGGQLGYLGDFNDKLNAIGYIDMDVYDRFPYKFFRSDVYDVDDHFPRITREELRPEIVKCDYTLSLSSIDKWREE